MGVGPQVADYTDIKQPFEAVADLLRRLLFFIACEMFGFGGALVPFPKLRAVLISALAVLRVRVRVAPALARNACPIPVAVASASAASQLK